MPDLASTIVGDPDDVARVPTLRQGVVTAVNPLMVQVGAATSSLACRALASYTATVGDTVSVLVISGDRLVLGLATQSGSTGYVNAVHPIHNGPSLWRQGAPGAGQYSLLNLGADTFVNADATLRLRQNNADRMWIDSGGVNVGNVPLYMNGNQSIQWNSWGGGWYMQDATWLRSVNNKNVWVGAGKFGSDGGLSLGFGGGGNDVGHIADINGYMRVTQRIDCNGVSAAGDGTFGNWMRAGVIGFTGADTDTYMDHPADGAIRWIANGGVAWEVSAAYGALGTNGAPIRLYSVADPNHGIQYNAGIGGVEIDGYADIRIYNVQGGFVWDFYADGWARAVNGHGWTTGSSIKIKENIHDLPPERAMQMVRDLRPVTYDRIDGTATDQIGLIAEWTAPVAPQVVAQESDEAPAGIDYGKLTPILLAAMQQLDARLNALEAT